jgi:hypothetical protein
VYVDNLPRPAAWIRAHSSEANFGVPVAGSVAQFAGLTSPRR